jgi:prolipoprotein diacylglyceryltransferase
MRALAWYSVIFNILVIIAFILFLADVLDRPPFSTLEAIAWVVLTLPVIILGVRVIGRSE